MVQAAYMKKDTSEAEVMDCDMEDVMFQLASGDNNHEESKDEAQSRNAAVLI